MSNSASFARYERVTGQVSQHYQEVNEFKKNQIKWKNETG